MNWPFYKRVIKAIVILLEKFSPFYLSVTTRIKQYDALTLSRYSQYFQIDASFAIVMQGPVVFKDDFTLNTLRLYRHLYPNIKLILSTWVFENADFEDSLKKLNITLLKNQAPGFAGLANVNMQIASTAGGLQLVDDGETKYVLKTRTDQRCCKAIDFIGYMRFLQESFALDKDVKLEKRLVVVSSDSFKNRMYGVTDFFMFGSIADMRMYWDIPFDNKTTAPENIPPDTMISYKIIEGYFVDHFFTNMGFHPAWTHNDSDYFFSRYFIMVDREQLDLYWFKYNRFFESIEDFSDKEYKIWQRRELADWGSHFKVQKG